MKVITAKLLLIGLLIGITSCKNETESCEDVFFGTPTENTGLSSDICKPICPCKNYTPKTFSAADVVALKEWKLVEPIALLDSDPYKKPLPEPIEGVCGLIVTNQNAKEYRLQSYTSEKAANDDGAIVTHSGPCGSCSSLKDLAVYVEIPSLGAPVRSCAMKNLLSPFEDLVECIKDVGFTDPCAQVWAFNTKNTQKKCLSVCIDEIITQAFTNEVVPFNNKDGSISPCIECDEIKSGPIFKYYSGRTRRNSGLPSAICRYCDEVVVIKHDYPF